MIPGSWNSPDTLHAVLPTFTSSPSLLMHTHAGSRNDLVAFPAPETLITSLALPPRSANRTRGEHLKNTEFSFLVYRLIT